MKRLLDWGGHEVVSSSVWGRWLMMPGSISVSEEECKGGAREEEKD
jgi:hypothetical protein